MESNDFDSLTFHVPSDPAAPLIYRSFEKIEERQKHGYLFRSKFHRVNILLLAECRRRLMKRQGKDTSQRWFATDLKAEIQVIQEYRSFFEDFLKNHCRTEEEFRALFEKWHRAEIDYGKYAVLLCEHSYFRIAKKHVNFSRFMEKIVNGLIENNSLQDLKQLYMQPPDDIRFAGEPHVSIVVGVSRYARQLASCVVNRD